MFNDSLCALCISKRILTSCLCRLRSFAGLVVPSCNRIADCGTCTSSYNVEYASTFDHVRMHRAGGSPRGGHGHVRAWHAVLRRRTHHPSALGNDQQPTARTSSGVNAMCAAHTLCRACACRSAKGHPRNVCGVALVGSHHRFSSAMEIAALSTTPSAGMTTMPCGYARSLRTRRTA